MSHHRQIPTVIEEDGHPSRPGMRSRSEPRNGNEHTLDDDASEIARSVLVGTHLGRTSSPHPIERGFRDLSEADHQDLPSLLERFSVRLAADATADPGVGA